VSTGDSITVELVSSATDDVRILVAEFDHILAAEYPREQRHGLALDGWTRFSGRISVLSGAVEWYRGGVALFADFAEVKCMYVRDAARGRGVLGRCLRELRDRRATLDLFCSDWRQECVR
jgi:putative acetyltransferase